MRRDQHKNHKRAKRCSKKHLTFLEALRLYAGMPVGVSG